MNLRKNRLLSSVAPIVLVTTFASGFSTSSWSLAHSNPPAQPGSVSAPRSNAPTPAQRLIAERQRIVAAAPNDATALSELAMAFAKRGRETADPSHYEKGLEVISTALEIDPTNLDARRNEVWLLLGLHDFETALSKARTLNEIIPDDPMVYGLLADAQVELGDYAGAEESVQWMLDLRPASVPALTRGAHLRELFGDLDGAIMWMSDALDRVELAQTEDRAWILTQLSHLENQRGNSRAAAELANAALELFPDYHYALAELAKASASEGDLEGALELWQRHYAVSPHPENLYRVAEALMPLDRREEAQPLYAEFERQALAESASIDNANGELISYWLATANLPLEALELATREVERRRTVYALDWYARALHANGRHGEAEEAIEEALAVGTVDPAILANARSILGGESEAATR